MAADDAAAADKWYDEAVVYPFGYGLSYTTFSWELVGAGQGEITAANETVTLKVKVTNTGNVAGKDIVQMYVNPPYTYGEIEKASANLMDFAKTDTLSPARAGAHPPVRCAGFCLLRLERYERQRLQGL